MGRAFLALIASLLFAPVCAAGTGTVSFSGAGGSTYTGATTINGIISGFGLLNSGTLVVGSGTASFGANDPPTLGADLRTLFQAFGRSDVDSYLASKQGDLNYDRYVDSIDFGIFVQNFRRDRPKLTVTRVAGLGILEPSWTPSTLNTGKPPIVELSPVDAEPGTRILQYRGHLTTQRGLTSVPASIIVTTDFNGDKHLDMSDAAIVLADFGYTGIQLASDLNWDSQVDTIDFTLLAALYNLPAAPMDVGVPTPEPSGIALGAFALTLLPRRRRCAWSIRSTGFQPLSAPLGTV